MRVLHVAHGWPPDALGGTELYAAALADAQARAGASVAHWTPAGLPRRRGFRSTFANPDAEADFARVARAFRPDVVHVHHLTGASLGIPAVAREGGARVVLTLHDAWLACARGQLVDRRDEVCAGPEERRCARCLAPATWAPLPASVADRLPLRRDLVRARAAALAAALRQVDHLLTPSRHLPARLGLTASYLPLPLLRAVPAAPVAAPGPVRFLFLGGLVPTKGPRLALEAFAGLPAGAATLRIVGPPLPYDGRTAYVDALTTRVREVPGARLEPPVAPEGVPALLGEADVLVFPSTWEENSPLVLREAAAAGLRIVASDVPGVAEVVGARAARVEPGSIEALRRAMAAEVRRGRARAEPARFEDIDAHAGRILDVYRAALADGRSRAAPGGRQDGAAASK